MKFLNPNRLRFSTLTNAVKTYLINTYDQTKNVFSKSSPFGQILDVVSEYYQLVLLYLEDVLVELNINTAQKQKSVFGLSRLAGHNPTRSLSAQGTLNLKISPTAKGDVNASYIMILDKTKLICKNNSFNYFIQLGNALDNIKIDINETKQIPIKIIQGEIEEQTVIGTGLPLQSFSMTSKKTIENEMVWIYVNGEPFEIVDSLYDMLKGENLCIVKTGISGGIDLYFGNEDYGVIPPIGSSILVRYVKTDGFSGNIFSKSNQVNWKWNESAFTNTGEEIDMNEMFITSIEKPVILGADSESLELTKIIAPKTSRSYVLANTDNYVSLLSRFNYSYVDAYTTFDDDYLDDDNIIYLFLIPDIIRRLSKNTDYFTTSVTNFYLGSDEKAALMSYINMSGQQIMSSEISIVDPIITKYALNIFLRIYDSVDSIQIQNEVTSKTTEYLLKVNRRDKIPKSDLVAIIENIPGVDSVSISYISEKNEKAINDGFYYQKVSSIDKIRGIMTVTDNRINLTTNEDPNLGLDEFGDIVIGLNELPIVRGGWYDRYSNYYEDGLSSTQFGSLNIVIKDVIRETQTIKMINKNKKSIK
tara:strand:+ start:907 stop:2670 length:1764 start_codon:yes stop_codon:yes gene_type:complete